MIVRVITAAKQAIRSFGELKRGLGVSLADLKNGAQVDISNAKEMNVDYTSFLKPPGYEERFVHDIPFDVKGSDKLAHFDPKEVVQKIILSQSGGDLEFSTIFHTFYDRFMQAMADQDHEFLNKYCEGRLATRIIKAADSLKQSKMKVCVDCGKIARN